MTFRTIRRIHTYGGVSAAIFLIVVGVTGIVLTFRSALRSPSVQVPEVMIDRPAIDKYDIIKKAELKMKLSAKSVNFSSSASQPHRVTFNNQQKTSLYYSMSGELIERRDRPKWSLVRLMFQLHTGSIVGRTGELIIAMIGGVLVISSISGLLIWPYVMKRIRRRKRLHSSS